MHWPTVWPCLCMHSLCLISFAGWTHFSSSWHKWPCASVLSRQPWYLTQPLMKGPCKLLGLCWRCGLWWPLSSLFCLNWTRWESWSLFCLFVSVCVSLFLSLSHCLSVCFSVHLSVTHKCTCAHVCVCVCVTSLFWWIGWRRYAFETVLTFVHSSISKLQYLLHESVILVLAFFCLCNNSFSFYEDDTP